MNVFRVIQRERMPCPVFPALGRKQAMTRYERRIVILGTGAVLLFAVVRFAVFPLLDGQRILARRVAAGEQALARLRTLAAEYRDLAAAAPDPAAVLAERQADFSLLSFLEDKAQAAGIRDRIAGMKPAPLDDANGYRGTVVSLRLEGLRLADLVRFLELTERPEEAVYVRRLAVRRRDEAGGLLDVRCEIVAIEGRE